jgi:hypothetical protein
MCSWALTPGAAGCAIARNLRRTGLRLALDLDVGEAQTGVDVARASACCPLPATDRDVDVAGIEFNSSGNSSSSLRREDGRAAAAEGVKDETVSATAIPDQISDETDRFGCGMELKITAPRWMQAVDARIIKNVGAVATLTPPIENY